MLPHCALFSLLFLGCGADFDLHKSIPPHLRKSDRQRLRFFDAGSTLAANPMKQAMLSTEVLERTEAYMTFNVSWVNAPEREIHPADWIGAFDRSLLSEFHAPVKFKYVFPVGARSPLPTSGSLVMKVWNLRSSYVFIYISGNTQYPEIIAQSDMVSFQSSSHPMEYHIAVKPSDPSKMLLMWTQAAPHNVSNWQPMLHYGTSPDKLDQSILAAKDTYTKTDFCDTETSPASRQGWFDPGHFMTVEIPVTPGQTYFYAATDEGSSLPPPVRNFTAPPAPGQSPTRLILLADMGNVPTDGSKHHSWDFMNSGELPSRNTTRLAGHLVDSHGAQAVVHFGDIAYSVGYLSEWDEFMLQVEPVASRVPWMASVGNHEIGWSQSDPFDGLLETEADSGGECGVAFLKRFSFAMQPLAGGRPWREASPWYSFSIGLVHFTMMSSEHDFRRNSSQWHWIVSDLKNVDRSVTPWVVVASHRGMYISSDWVGDQEFATLLQQNLEKEMLEAGVDFFVAGHHHSYQRLCKLNNNTCVDASQPGINHFIMGMAGYDHSKVGKTSNITLFTDEERWGVTFWEFSSDSASMSYFDGATDTVVDSFTFHKQAKGSALTFV